jgi:hypothetical protein
MKKQRIQKIYIETHTNKKENINTSHTKSLFFKQKEQIQKHKIKRTTQ